MRIKSLIAGFCVLASSSLAQAQELYRLEAGDQVELWTSVDASMRRTVTVGPDGWLSLPLAGHLQGAGLTLPELEQAIEERLRKYFKEEPDLTVMLLPGAERSQTIYVSGDVATPGAYPFRPGLLVAHSLSMAGGQRRGAAAASDEEREVTVRGEIGRTKARISALSAQKARIESERDDASEIKQDGAAARDIEREQAIMQVRLSDKADKLKAHQETLALRRRAITSLQGQAGALELRIKLSQERLSAVSRLVTKGFANEAQQIEGESDIAELQASRHELQTQIVNAELDVAAEIARFREVSSERLAQLTVDLRDTQRELDSARSGLSDSERILGLLVNGAPDAGDDETGPPSISIVRLVNGQAVEIDAYELTEIKAGDLVRVGRPAPVGQAPDTDPAATSERGTVDDQRSRS